MPAYQNDPVASVVDNSHSPSVEGVNSTLKGVGVLGRSTHQAGVLGESAGFNGVLGYTTANGHSGVAGISDEGNGNGVYGRSKNVNGVVGYSSATGHNGVAGVNEEGNGNGVYGRSKRASGVYGESAEFNGVLGITTSNGHSGVAGVSNSGVGNGVYGRSQQGHAGYFEGSVWVSKKLIVGDDIVLSNADCAEDFDIAGLQKVEPGTVMVIDSEGALRPSEQAYDKRVAGVISGAGNFKPGIVLDKQKSSRNRMPIALLGKVYCKVDASYGAIEVGDLLTTSPTLGHAMKVSDPLKAFGAVIGKALRPFEDGQGLIPILIALQ